MVDRFSEWMEEGSLYVALVAAWVAMLGSLYFSEVAGYVPCTFCWYQRILMYPLTVILTVGLLRRDRSLPIYILPLSLLGIGVATYHYLLQKTNLFDNVSTCQVGVPCSGIWINWFGFITIPFLSLTAFIVITFMTIIAWQAGLPEEPDWDAEGPIRRPWLPVAGLIVLIALIFFILGQMSTGGADAHAAENFPVLATGAQTALDGTPLAGEHAAEHNEDGQLLYDAACAACHGATAEGVANVGTDLTASTRLRTETEEAILAYIRAGSAIGAADNSSGIAMPASGGRPDLSDEQLLAIVRYLRTNLVDVQ